MKVTLFPGSFDPITYGHIDVVDQALKIYDKVIICVLINSSKNKGLFSIKERAELIKEIYKDNPNIEVMAVDRKIATVDVALENGCNTIIRGLRNVSDFAVEIEQAKLNLEISENKVNTVALFASQNKTAISSSMVKELFSLGKSISNYVHPVVEEAMRNKVKE